MNNKDKGALMLRYAMNYGIVLGSFWTFKYLFFITSLSLKGFSSYSYLSDTFLYLYLYVLPVITLSLYYVLLKRFRDNKLAGKINYIQCILFSIMLFFFASLVESVIIYIYHKFFADPLFLIEKEKGWLEILLQSLYSKEWLNAQRETYGNVITLISEIVKNVIIGFFLSLVYGIFVSRNKKNIE